MVGFEGELLVCSLELPLEKGAPGKLDSTPTLYPFCSFIHKKGEILYTLWGAGSGRERGEAGNSDRLVLWENEWVTLPRFYNPEINLHPFPNGRDSNHLASFLEVVFLVEAWWRAREDVDQQEKPGIQCSPVRVEIDQKWPRAGVNSRKVNILSEGN